MINLYAFTYMRGCLSLVVGNWLAKRAAKKHEAEVLEACGCVCFCPKCHDILNDQAEWIPDETDDGRGIYSCSCGHQSDWHFGVAPVPVLLNTQLNTESK